MKAGTIQTIILLFCSLCKLLILYYAQTEACIIFHALLLGGFWHFQPMPPPSFGTWRNEHEALTRKKVQ